MILGCDAAGVDEDGNEVVVHAVISDPAWRGDETVRPARSLLSERYQGTFAEQVAVPRANVVPKPAVAVVRGGGLPADRLADGLPDALRPGRPEAGRDRARAGRGRRRGDRVISAVATPPPAPCTSTVWPGFRPPWTKSIRYAVSQAVGRQAASSKRQRRRLRYDVAPRHRDPVGERALVALGEQRPPRVLGLVAAPGRVADHRVDEHLVAVLVEAGGVAAEDHRQRLLAQPDTAQRPEVVVVERRRLHLDRRPAVGDLGVGPLPHHQAAQRVVGGEGLGVHGEQARP